MNFEELFRQFRLDGHTAIVTGIGPGIGETVARSFASAGASVVLCARTATRVQAVADGITNEGGRALAVPGDIGRKEDVVRLVEETRRVFGPASIIFHNAMASGGVGQDRSGLELSDADWQSSLDVNLLAPFRLAREFIPDMQANGGGSIINVLSTAGFTPVPGIAAWAYGATKAALEMLTRYIAKEHGPQVRANCICPGTIAPDGEVRDIWKPIIGRIPLGRVGFAREVAAAALYLASSASSYVTGQTIFVDGGRVSTAA